MKWDFFCWVWVATLSVPSQEDQCGFINSSGYTQNLKGEGTRHMAATAAPVDRRINRPLCLGVGVYKCLTHNPCTPPSQPPGLLVEVGDLGSG